MFTIIANSMLFANLLINISLDVFFDLPDKRLNNDKVYFAVTVGLVAIIDLFIAFNTNQINNILPVSRPYIALILLFKTFNLIGITFLLIWLVLTFRKTCRIVKMNQIIKNQN